MRTIAVRIDEHEPVSVLIGLGMIVLVGDIVLRIDAVEVSVVCLCGHEFAMHVLSDPEQPCYECINCKGFVEAGR
jgi:hypothetical protein